MAQFRLLGAKFGLLSVTLNSGVYFGYSNSVIGHPGLVGNVLGTCTKFW